jgi:hypothetical protein
MKIVSKVSKRVTVAVALAVGAVCGSVAHADSVTNINLLTVGATGTDNQGAVFSQTQIQPTGTGVIDPFLTIQRRGTEHGFNTDAAMSALTLDDHRAASAWVRSVKIDDIGAVDLYGNGTLYATFLLDINEDNSAAGHLLSLNKLQLFSTTDPNLTGYNEASFTTGQATDGFGGNATMLYNLDKTVDYTVELDYSLAHGSGSGDMYAYIPYDVIMSQLGQSKYLVLYSSFGSPNPSSAGFEEWAVVTGDHPTPPVPGPGLPLPSAATGGAVVLGLMGFRRRSRKHA